MIEQRPRWFTIKTAAAYLDVGEPTIYRWMREGKITFRKVGDSTRFLKPDLDAVIQVHPSHRDVDQVTEFCPACHHTELVSGRVQGTGLVYFRPEKAKFWTFRTNNVDTQARMCARCGVIVWVGDVEQLAALRLQQRKDDNVGDDN